MATKQRKQDKDVMDMAAEKIKMDVLLRDVNTAPTNVKSKRTFEFKMCKKVAELTQVVHMLFTRNHEKEVEIDALKDAYEEEITSVITDARGRIAQMDRELLEARKKAMKDTSKLKDDMRESFKNQERKHAEEIKERDEKISKLQKEMEDLKKQLLAANAAVYKFEQGVSNESQDLLRQIREKDKQLNKLEGHLANKEKSLHEKEHLVKKLTKQLEQTEARLANELQELKKTLAEVTESRDSLILKNRHLEEDLRLLKKELRKRLQNGGDRDSANSNQPKTHGNPNEEIERLKREIRWYRMELSNREGNFNRVFAENRPVRIDSRAGGLGHFTREKTLVACDDMGSSMGMAGRDVSRLPVLGMDHSRRPTNVNVVAYTSGSQRSLSTKDSKR
ncbi:uncharacterized protein PF3D7_1120000-like isoform X2 [Ptychodera flava]|uniref:uncharacterized protein PF3D7_1120000-like isoform X2 n=1 Tax=Ptychodera flava TaxID=63121 RepID=UPI003969D8D0